MNKKEQDFIIMRANGITFDKMAEELKTTKATLIKWSKKFQSEIDDIKFESMVKLKEQFEYSNQKKYAQLLEQQQKVNEAILKLDLQDCSLKDLISAQKYTKEEIEILEGRTLLRKTDVMEDINIDFLADDAILKLDEI